MISPHSPLAPARRGAARRADRGRKERRGQRIPSHELDGVDPGLIDHDLARAHSIAFRRLVNRYPLPETRMLAPGRRDRRMPSCRCRPCGRGDGRKWMAWLAGEIGAVRVHGSPWRVRDIRHTDTAG